MIFSVIIILIALLASFASLHSIYWFLPVIFGVTLAIGYNTKRSSVVDVSLILLFFSFLFLNQDLSRDIPNLILSVGFIFLFFGIWFFTKFLLYYDRVERTSRVSSKGKQTSVFTRSAKNYMFYGIILNTFIGAIISAIATLLGSYSSLRGIMGGRLETTLMILFTFILFSIIFLMVHILMSSDD